MSDNSVGFIVGALLILIGIALTSAIAGLPFPDFWNGNCQ